MSNSVLWKDIVKILFDKVVFGLVAGVFFLLMQYQVDKKLLVVQNEIQEGLLLQQSIIEIGRRISERDIDLIHIAANELCKEYRNILQSFIYLKRHPTDNAVKAMKDSIESYLGNIEEIYWEVELTDAVLADSIRLLKSKINEVINDLYTDRKKLEDPEMLRRIEPMQTLFSGILGYISSTFDQRAIIEAYERSMEVYNKVYPVKESLSRKAN